VYDEVFFCPDDRTYADFARQIRENQSGNFVYPNSYALSDTALWSPKMFTKERVGEILVEDQMNEDGASPSCTEETDGRMYLRKEHVRYPDKKVYFYEHGAFHESGNFGWNEPDMRATVLFYDGHAENRQSDQSTKPLLTTYAPRVDEGPIMPPWYYGTTQDGIRGRDVE